MSVGPPPPHEKPSGALRLAVLSTPLEARSEMCAASGSATFIHIGRDGSACLLTADLQHLDLLFNDGTLVPVKPAPTKARRDA